MYIRSLYQVLPQASYSGGQEDDEKVDTNLQLWTDAQEEWFVWWMVGVHSWVRAEGRRAGACASEKGVNVNVVTKKWESKEMWGQEVR